MPSSRTLILTLALASVSWIASVPSTTLAQGPRARAEKIAYYHAQQRPWHGPYSYTQYGTPVALVVPPTAQMQSSYAWGVSQTEVRPIYHRYGRNYNPGEPTDVDVHSGNNFLPTPLWPSHTDQFGMYYIRGPY